jgi:hypothetical protein
MYSEVVESSVLLYGVDLLTAKEIEEMLATRLPQHHLAPHQIQFHNNSSCFVNYIHPQDSMLAVRILTGNIGAEDH